MTSGNRVGGLLGAVFLWLKFMLLPKSLLIKIAREVDRPALRKELEKFWQGCSFFSLAMVVRAVLFFATRFQALSHLVVRRMEVFFAPAVRFLA